MARYLAFQGIDNDDATRLRALLAQAAPKLSTRWLEGAGADAQLLVIDVDTVYGHMDWLRAHNTRLIAAMTSHTQTEEYELLLAKPLSLENLIDVLERAASLTADGPEPAPTPAAAPPPAVEKAPARPAPVAAAAPAPKPAPVPAPELPPAPEPPKEKRLYDWLADHALAAAVRIQSPDAPDLVLDPAHRTYYADGNLRALAPHCGRIVTNEELHEVNPMDLARLQASGKGQPFARLIWLSHVLGSNGHLAPGLDINAKYKMARWPQIDREFPKHFRIATVMMKQPATLNEIAEQSGATLGDTIDFVNGYHAIGYVEVEGAATAAEPAARDTGRGAILSRLKNPFGGT